MKYSLGVLTSVLVFISSSHGCKDNAPNCAAWNANGFCTSPFYDTNRRMSYCALTCGLCSATGSTTSLPASNQSISTANPASTVPGVATTKSTSTCKDATPSCAAWVKNGYCTSTFYSEEAKKEKCPKSCNLC